MPAAATALNGAGELTGYLQISEWGLIETPIFLTSTMAVGRVFDGAVALAYETDAAVGGDEVVIPVVGECDDSWLDDRAPCRSRRRTPAAPSALRWVGPSARDELAPGRG